MIQTSPENTADQSNLFGHVRVQVSKAVFYTVQETCTSRLVKKIHECVSPLNNTDTRIDNNRHCV